MLVYFDSLCKLGNSAQDDIHYSQSISDRNTTISIHVSSNLIKSLRWPFQDSIHYSHSTSDSNTFIAINISKKNLYDILEVLPAISLLICLLTSTWNIECSCSKVFGRIKRAIFIPNKLSVEHIVCNVYRNRIKYINSL